MNLFSVLSIMAVTFYAYVGIYTYRNKRNAVSRTFMFMCLSLAVWSFGYAFVYASEGGSSFWMKASAFGWCTFSALALHTAVRFTDIKLFRRLLPQILIYTPAAVFLFMSVFLFGPHSAPSKAVSDFFYTGDFLYDVIYPLAAFALLARMKRKTALEAQKKQLDGIMLACLIPFVLNELTQFLLPALGFHLIPPAGQLFAVILVGGIHFANVRFGLFGIPFHILYDEILTEMMDLFFLLTPEGRIVKVNSRTLELLGRPQEELEGMELAELCLEKPAVRAHLEQEAAAGSTDCAEIHFAHRSGVLIPIRFTCSRLEDRSTGDLLGIMGIGQDITVKKQLEEEIRIQQEYERKLKQSEAQFRAMFDNHAAVMILTDPQSLEIIGVNHAAEAFYGYAAKQFVGMQITELNGLSDQEAKTVAMYILKDQGALLHLRHRLANGDTREVEIHSSSVPYEGKLVIYSIVHDITERKKAEEYIRFLAYNDSLTGLSNRKRFYDAVEQALSASQESGGSLAVMYIDMDDLKYINDTFGHENGDLVLRELGARLKASVPDGGLIARLGGDEFAIMVPDVLLKVEAVRMADEISACLRKPIRMAGLDYTVHVSIGISLFPDDGLDVDTLLKKADLNMYAMKRKKKKTAR